MIICFVQNQQCREPSVVNWIRKRVCIFLRIIALSFYAYLALSIISGFDIVKRADGGGRSWQDPRSLKISRAD